MPHITVVGPCRIDSYYEKYAPLTKSDHGAILKIRACYISHYRNELLIESIVVEAGRPQTFFVSVSQREGSVLVHLLPLTDPEKTDGVRRLLAAVARQVLALQPGCNIGATNLQTYLED